jgi:hypothetical protein
MLPIPPRIKERFGVGVGRAPVKSSETISRRPCWPSNTETSSSDKAAAQKMTAKPKRELFTLLLIQS